MNESSGDVAWNDHVEVFIDGDGVANDFFTVSGNREGSQIIADVRGPQYTYAMDFVNFDWNVGAGLTDEGYIIEFEIPLDLIDTRDGPGTSPPTTGSTLLMNAAIIDNEEHSEFEQQNYAMLWSDEPALSPFQGGEDTWVVPLRLTSGGD